MLFEILLLNFLDEVKLINSLKEIFLIKLLFILLLKFSSKFFVL